MPDGEIFRPVAALYKVYDIDAAIALANDSPFGLVSSIWTTDKVEQGHAISEIEAGSTFVNAKTASHLALRFGGIKRSSYGRELAAEDIPPFAM